MTEALELHRSFHRAPRDAGELLERFGLAEHGGQRFGSLSGAQQQRLSVALAVVGNPRIAILYELTTGLDPHGRRDIWTFLDELRPTASPSCSSPTSWRRSSGPSWCA